MQQYQPVTSEFINKLQAVVGEKYVFTEADKLDAYKTDEEADPRFHHLPEVVVFPADTQQVAEVVKLANEYKVPITPRCAGTGLAGGAIPIYGGMVMVLERMDQILDFNQEKMYVTAQAGVRTDFIQKEAAAQGLLYAGDPCSSDSCQIGGNAATNAGGNRAVRYGTTRDQIYAVKVVTAQGDIVELGGRLAKKTTGYALEQLLVGSEGTLGIITEVTLKLKPLAPHNMSLCAVFDDIDKALVLPNLVFKAGIIPLSMEFMDNNAVQSTARYTKVALPYADQKGIYVLITIEGFNEEVLEQELEILDELCTQAGAVEVLMADDRIWQARRDFAEAARADSLIHYMDDIVVPIDKIGEVIKKIPYYEEKYNCRTTTAGHIGDGNIHLTVLKGNIPDEDWVQTLESFHAELYEFVYELGGRLSGEHGIGYKKLHDMEIFTPKAELDMMRAIKKALDPNGILNPGKIFN